MNASRNISTSPAGASRTLSRTLNDRISVVREDDRIVVSRPSEDKTSKSLHGLTRTLVANMVQGVTIGYRKPLEIVRGFPVSSRASLAGETVADSPGVVVLLSRIGGNRVVDMLSGEQLPRIC